MKKRYLGRIKKKGAESGEEEDDPDLKHYLMAQWK